MVTRAVSTRIEVVVDARSQFVAFASSSIERCGVGSAAQSLSHNGALCELFGRDWVVGCCYQVGTTAELHGGGSFTTGRKRSANVEATVHVFMGVSATLGVVWCRCVDARPLLLMGAYFHRIAACIGDRRFLATTLTMRDVAKVVDTYGRVVAELGGRKEDWAFGTLGGYASNCKWLVVINDIMGRGLIVWRMGGGVPLGDGVSVRWTTGQVKKCGFSRFDPCSDELVFIGYNRDANATISFVNLERTIEAGVAVQSRPSLLLPHPSPIDFAWTSPDTILTLHNDTTFHSFEVYNTNSGEVHTFPHAKYSGIYSVPPGAHIAALLHSVRRKKRRLPPTCANPERLSLKGINSFPAESAATGALATTEIRDAFTQKCIARIHCT
ncbi:hypothetical protein Pelo_18610 [Pelomyxa schiedti]|nr:hypothetical protein Pelo_18610 [Pelomyxa schiedti]